jgi:thiol-disulfide isomerase/thioredoxin
VALMDEFGHGREGWIEGVDWRPGRPFNRSVADRVVPYNGLDWVQKLERGRQGKTGNPMRGLFIMLGCCCLTFGCGRSTGNDATAAGQVSLKILDFDGLQQLLADERGHVVVMDCWSTGCPPCVRDFPQLVALDRKYRERGLNCISLSFDYEGIGKPAAQAPRVLQFLREQEATFDNVLSSVDSDSLYQKLQIASIPVVFVYDRQGKLRERFTEPPPGKGPPLYDQVQAAVEKLLTEH